jgi:hypothetical protein
VQEKLDWFPKPRIVPFERKSWLEKKMTYQNSVTSTTFKRSWPFSFLWCKDLAGASNSPCAHRLSENIFFFSRKILGRLPRTKPHLGMILRILSCCQYLHLPTVSQLRMRRNNETSTADHCNVGAYSKRHSAAVRPQKSCN